jgi:surface antigen
MKKITAIILCAFTLSACQEGQNEGFGTLFGAVGGALIGSAIAGDGGRHGHGNDGAIIFGALAGAVIGNSIGKKLDEADRMKMYQAQQVAFENYPSGQSSSWYNPDTGNSGSYTPRPAEQGRNGMYCREYQQTVTIGGKVEEAYGQACRQPDGNWKIINDRI